LIFFATNCKPCIRGLKMLAANKKRLKDAKLKIVLIAFKQTEDVVKPFAKEMGLDNFTILPDRFGSISGSFGIVSEGDDGSSAKLPTTFLLSKEGVINKIFGKEGEDYIDKLASSN
ncbi:MAG: TlpA disulfide reductase family protein, partial [Phycisphaerae bacterium]|nr:TlpA disulfide reductase family protein [Phycisphaerae bacterium]